MNTLHWHCLNAVCGGLISDASRIYPVSIVLLIKHLTECGKFIPACYVGIHKVMVLHICSSAVQTSTTLCHVAQLNSSLALRTIIDLDCIRVCFLHADQNKAVTHQGFIASSKIEPQNQTVLLLYAEFRFKNS